MKTQEITVEYREHLGSDLSVVNAARASFGKESHWGSTEEPDLPHGFPARRALKPVDANLIRYLATGFRTSEWDEFLDEVAATARGGNTENLATLLREYKRRAQHFAPFCHPHVTIRMAIPLFLARQLVKHQIGGVWSEESRRYISEEPGVYIPSEWHIRPEDVKQGSGGAVANQDFVRDTAEKATEASLLTYAALLGEGVAPEEARMILPLNTVTTVVWTGSLLFWSRVYNQRHDSHAQLAAQEFAAKLSKVIQPLYPVSWEALTN